MPKQLKAIVCGVGRMGLTIAWSMDKFGFHVVGLDQSEKASGLLPSTIDFVSVKTKEDTEKVIKMIGPDIVISSLPYHQTEEVAKICRKNKYNYCDLGGHVKTSQNINNRHGGYGKTSGKHIFTDLGLAPGWINILLEHGCKQLYGHSHKIEDIKMMVGGIPKEPDNPPLNYAVTWSVDGLLNEYKDKCRILVDGEERCVNGMEGLETITTKSLGELEAFYTSGGMAHSIKSMKERGVKNCAYKTLRYKGHGETINFLIRNSELSEGCLSEIFNKGCPNKAGSEDLVIMKVIIKAEESSWEKEILIEGGTGGYDRWQSGGFSAMQKATGFSVASVAKMMAEDFFEKNPLQRRDHYDLVSTALSYKDVDYEEFIKNIDFLRQKIGDAKPYEQD